MVPIQEHRGGKLRDIKSFNYLLSISCGGSELCRLPGQKLLIPEWNIASSGNEAALQHRLLQ